MASHIKSLWVRGQMLQSLSPSVPQSLSPSVPQSLSVNASAFGHFRLEGVLFWMAKSLLIISNVGRRKISIAYTSCVISFSPGDQARWAAAFPALVITLRMSCSFVPIHPPNSSSTNFLLTVWAASIPKTSVPRSRAARSPLVVRM